MAHTRRKSAQPQVRGGGPETARSSHQPQPITGRIVQVLGQPQVALGGLDGGVPQRNLDLFERRTAEVGVLGVGAPEIVRRDLAEAGLTGIGNDRLEDRLRRDQPGQPRPPRKRWEPSSKAQRRENEQPSPSSSSSRSETRWT